MEIETFYSFPEDETLLPMKEEMLYWTAFSPPPPEYSLDLPPPTVESLPDHFDLVPAPPPPPTEVLPSSAFVAYVRPLGNGSSHSQVACCKESVHKRVLELLRRIPPPRKAENVSEEKSGGSGGGGGSRCFRHMMRERERRERLSQSYADLYAMVSPKSKADKNSIVQSSASYLKELKGKEAELRRRNCELRIKAEAKTEAAKIRLTVGNPSSSIDSMIGALHCLKGMEVKAKAIESRFSVQELSATIDIELTKEKTATEEVEKAVQEALVKVEKKRKVRAHHPALAPRTIGWSGGAHMPYTL